jgi:hypothetical protein
MFSCLLVSTTKIGIQTCNTNQKDNQQGGGTKPANQMNLLDLSMPTVILWHAEAMDAMLYASRNPRHKCTNLMYLLSGCCYNVISGWWFQPLWKILVNWNHYSQYMKKNMFQTTKPDIECFCFFLCIYLILLWNPIFELCGTVLSRNGDRSAWNGVPQKSYGWSSSSDLFNLKINFSLGWTTIFPDCIPSCSCNVVPSIISWFITLSTRSPNYELLDL